MHFVARRIVAATLRASRRRMCERGKSDASAVSVTHKPLTIGCGCNANAHQLPIAHGDAVWCSAARGMFAAVAERPAAKMRTRLKATRARFFNTHLGTLQHPAKRARAQPCVNSPYRACPGRENGPSVRAGESETNGPRGHYIGRMQIQADQQQPAKPLFTIRN